VSYLARYHSSSRISLHLFLILKKDEQHCRAKKRLLSYDISYHKRCGRLSLELHNSRCLKENGDASQKRTRLAMTRSATARAPGRGDMAQGAPLQDARGHGGSFISSGQDRTSLQVIAPKKEKRRVCHFCERLRIYRKLGMSVD
jgi:hypothetical protein